MKTTWLILLLSLGVTQAPANPPEAPERGAKETASLEELFRYLDNKEYLKCNSDLVLGHEGDERAISMLKKRINAKNAKNDPSHRLKIAYFLLEISGNGKEALPVMLDILNSTKEDDLQFEVIFTMAHSSLSLDEADWKVAFPVFMRFLKKDKTCGPAAFGLGRAPPEYRKKVLPILLEMSRNPQNSAWRFAAVHGLRSIGTENSPLVLPAILERLNDPDSICREAAVRNLFEPEIGSSKHWATIKPAILKGLVYDKSKDVRAEIAGCLLYYLDSTELPKIVPELIKATGDSDVRVREYMAKALGMCSKESSKDTTRILRKLLKDKEMSVVAQSIVTLWKLGDESREATEAAMTLLRSNSGLGAWSRIVNEVDNPAAIPEEVLSIAREKRFTVLPLRLR